LFLPPPNVPSIASDIFFGKFFKSSNEVIGMAATPKGFSGNHCCLLVEVKLPLVCQHNVKIRTAILRSLNF
jgi:hypothetical protein